MLALEIKVTRYGLLTIGGAISLVFGSLMLIDSSVPELQLSLRFVLPVVGACVSIAGILIWLGVSALRIPATGGVAGMIGLVGRTVSSVGPTLRDVSPWAARRGALTMTLSPGLVVVLIVALYLIASIKIRAEYESGVIFRLGKLLPQIDRSEDENHARPARPR